MYTVAPLFVARMPVFIPNHQQHLRIVLRFILKFSKMTWGYKLTTIWSEACIFPDRLLEMLLAEERWAVNVLYVSAVVKNKHCSVHPAPLATVHLLLKIFPLQHGVIQTSPGWHRNVNVSSSGTSCLPVTCLVNLTACVMASVWPHSLKRSVW